VGIRYGDHKTDRDYRGISTYISPSWIVLRNRTSFLISAASWILTWRPSLLKNSISPTNTSKALI